MKINDSEMTNHWSSDLVTKIKIELRKRLGICQFYFLLNNADTGNSSQIILYDDRICIDDKEIQIGVQVSPDSLCALTYSNNVLSYRIRLKQQDLSNCKTSIASIFDHLSSIPLLQSNVPLMLYCVQCNCTTLETPVLVSSISSEEVNAIDASDIFCHRGEDILNFEKANFIQSSGSYLVHCYIGSISLLEFPAKNTTAILENRIMYCRKCFAWLGLSSEYFGCRFWSDTVKFTNLDMYQKQEDFSKNIFYSMLFKVTIDCLFPICNIVFKTNHGREEKFIFISILDRQLKVLESEDMGTIREHTYLKLMYRLLDVFDEKNSNFIHKIEIVSKPTFLFILKCITEESNDFENGTVYLMI